LVKIYHYTRFVTAIEHILPDMQLRTSSLHKMNDPKENQPWSFGGRNIDYGGSYPETYSHDTHIDHQYRLWEDIKSSSQIICFVKDEPEKGFLNEIMWAHYSDNHRGVCLELDADILIQENKVQLTDYIFEPVTYGKHERLFFSWDSQLDKEQNIQRFIRTKYKDLFLRKSNYWERENEKRLIIFNNTKKYLTIKRSLTGIYFGLLMPISYRPSIDRFINQEQTKLYDLYYEDNMIKIMETKKNDFRPLITRKYLKKE
jgi:Protein of unknown function (DUF2971)